MIDRFLRQRRLKIVKSFAKRLPMDARRITLCDRNAEMCAAWKLEFEDVDEVEIVCGNLTDVDCDALVSAANSFGDMSGGVDKAIDDFYEGRAQRLLIPEIRGKYFGEMPVGTATHLPISGARIPYLIAAPTMRTPGPVHETLNAYLAFRAVLVAVAQHNQRTPKSAIRHIAVPGLCTGVGRMPFARSAEQMRAAYDNIISEEWIDIAHPAQAPFPTGASASKKWEWAPRENENEAV